MPFDEPFWWYDLGRQWPARLLTPVERAYGDIVARRIASAVPYRSRLPVICVGNFTAGGTGKTPMAIHVAAVVRTLGRNPAFLSRGYGGRIAGPHRVVAGDTAADVGDEPLLLARTAPVIIARDRAAGARAIEGAAAGPETDVIIMDDGLQNPRLAKTLTLAVVDGQRGFGNGRVIPSGPLRVSLSLQLNLTDAIVINTPSGVPDTELVVASRLRQEFKGPVLAATTRVSGAVDWIREQPLVAYCGIGSPQRFFDLLASLGATLAASEIFPDHHRFTTEESRRLLTLARRQDAQLVTTEKDLARLSGSGGAHAELLAASRALAIAAAFEPRDAERLNALLAGALHANSRPA